MNPRPPASATALHSRRGFCAGAGWAMVLVALPGCGFAPRKAQTFKFKSLYSTLSETSPLGVQLRRALQATGAVRIIIDPRDIGEADAILEVLADQREKIVLSSSAAGQVREFQLRLRFVFRLKSPAGAELLGSTEVLQQRDTSFSESAALAQEAQETILFQDMQNDIVQQILRQLAAYTPPQ